MHLGRSRNDVVVVLLEHEAGHGHVRADGRVEIRLENPHLTITLLARISAVAFDVADKGIMLYLHDGVHL